MATTGRARVAYFVGACALVCALLSGCDSTGDGDSGDGATESASSPSAVDVPDACSFLTATEIGSVLGTRVDAGDAQLAPEGSSACRFGGIANVTVNTYATTPGDFDELRDLYGGDEVGDLGDGAFSIDDVLLHVRVDDRAFSIRINDEQHRVDDVAQARRTLAEAGVAKLR